jgi:hypothetical protein
MPTASPEMHLNQLLARTVSYFILSFYFFAVRELRPRVLGGANFIRDS